MTVCLKCGLDTRRLSPEDVELIETHELCVDCRTADLRKRATYLRDELNDLADDYTPVAGRIPPDLETLITRLTGARP